MNHANQLDRNMRLENLMNNHQKLNRIEIKSSQNIYTNKDFEKVNEIGEQTLGIKADGNGPPKLAAAASSTQYSNKRSTVMTAPHGQNLPKNESNIGMVMLSSEGSYPENYRYDDTSAYEVVNNLN